MIPKFRHVPPVVCVRLIFQSTERLRHHFPNRDRFIFLNVDERGGGENQPLHELFFWTFQFFPQTFQHFVNFPKAMFVKELAGFRHDGGRFILRGRQIETFAGQHFA